MVEFESFPRLDKWLVIVANVANKIEGLYAYPYERLGHANNYT